MNHRTRFFKMCVLLCVLLALSLLISACSHSEKNNTEHKKDLNIKSSDSSKETQKPESGTNNKEENVQEESQTEEGVPADINKNCDQICENLLNKYSKIKAVVPLKECLSVCKEADAECNKNINPENLPPGMSKNTALTSCRVMGTLSQLGAMHPDLDFTNAISEASGVEIEDDE